MAPLHSNDDTQTRATNNPLFALNIDDIEMICPLGQGVAGFTMLVTLKEAVVKDLPELFKKILNDANQLVIKINKGDLDESTRQLINQKGDAQGVIKHPIGPVSAEDKAAAQEDAKHEGEIGQAILLRTQHQDKAALPCALSCPAALLAGNREVNITMGSYVDFAGEAMDVEHFFQNFYQNHSHPAAIENTHTRTISEALINDADVMLWQIFASSREDVLTLHDLGIFHNDVAARNTMMTKPLFNKYGQLEKTSTQLIDFGQSQFIDPETNFAITGNDANHVPVRTVPPDYLHIRVPELEQGAPGLITDSQVDMFALLQMGLQNMANLLGHNFDLLVTTKNNSSNVMEVLEELIVTDEDNQAYLQRRVAGIQKGFEQPYLAVGLQEGDLPIPVDPHLQQHVLRLLNASYQYMLQIGSEYYEPGESKERMEAQAQQDEEMFVKTNLKVFATILNHRLTTSAGTQPKDFILSLARLLHIPGIADHLAELQKNKEFLSLHGNLPKPLKSGFSTLQKLLDDPANVDYPKLLTVAKGLHNALAPQFGLKPVPMESKPAQTMPMTPLASATGASTSRQHGLTRTHKGGHTTVPTMPHTKDKEAQRLSGITPEMIAKLRAVSAPSTAPTTEKGKAKDKSAEKGGLMTTLRGTFRKGKGKKKDKKDQTASSTSSSSSSKLKK